MKRLTAHVKEVKPDREAGFKASASAAVKKVCILHTVLCILYAVLCRHQ